MKPLSLVILAGLAMHYCSLAVHGWPLIICIAAIFIMAGSDVNNTETT